MHNSSESATLCALDQLHRSATRTLGSPGTIMASLRHLGQCPQRSGLHPDPMLSCLRLCNSKLPQTPKELIWIHARPLRALAKMSETCHHGSRKTKNCPLKTCTVRPLSLSNQTIDYCSPNIITIAVPVNTQCNDCYQP